MMKKYKIQKISALVFLTAIAIFSSFLAVKKQAKKPNKPNILIIYPDQFRWYSAGFWSEPKYLKHVVGKPDPVVTPNIDRLAKKWCRLYKWHCQFSIVQPVKRYVTDGSVSRKKWYLE